MTRVNYEGPTVQQALHDPLVEGRILYLPFTERSEAEVDGHWCKFHVDARNIMFAEVILHEVYVCRLTVVPVNVGMPYPDIREHVNLEIFRNRKRVYGVNLPKKWRKNSRHQLAEDLVNIASEYVTLQNIQSVHSL